MAKNLKMLLVLTGSREGCTVKLGKMYQFTNGKLTLNGPSHDVHSLAHYLAVNYQAYEEGSEELEAYYGSRVEVSKVETKRDKEPSLLSNKLPDGGGPSELSSHDSTGSDNPPAGDSGPGSEGDGSKESRILEVLNNQLDRENDDHWVADGSPKMAVVEAMLGDKVTRKELDVIALGFNRG